MRDKEVNRGSCDENGDIRYFANTVSVWKCYHKLFQSSTPSVPQRSTVQEIVIMMWCRFLVHGIKATIPPYYLKCELKDNRRDSSVDLAIYRANLQLFVNMDCISMVWEKKDRKKTEDLEPGRVKACQKRSLALGDPGSPYLSTGSTRQI